MPRCRSVEAFSDCLFSVKEEEPEDHSIEDFAKTSHGRTSPPSTIALVPSSHRVLLRADPNATNDRRGQDRTHTEGTVKREPDEEVQGIRSHQRNGAGEQDGKDDMDEDESEVDEDEDDASYVPADSDTSVRADSLRTYYLSSLVLPSSLPLSL